jgi:hypothetical protein
MSSSQKTEKAAVVIPPFTDFYSTPHRFSTLGAGIVTRILEKKGIEVEFFNFPEQNSRGTSTTLPTTLQYLKSHLISNETGRCSFFTQYKLFGPALEECVRQIIATSPDIIFISCFAFCYSDTAISLCWMLKEKLPDCTIVVGGSGVSVNQGYFIAGGCIDFAVSGEAEVSLVPFIELITSNNNEISTVPNISTKNVRSNSGSPDLFTDDKSIEPGFRTVLHNDRLRIDLTISRGCPFQCTFCSNHLSQGNEFRRVSLDKIKDSIKSIRDTLSVEPSSVEVNFEDDNLLIDPQFWFETISLFKSSFSQVSLYAENGLDYRLLTGEYTKYLINQGMAQFNIALGNISTKAEESLSRKT